MSTASTSSTSTGVWARASPQGQQSGRPESRKGPRVALAWRRLLRSEGQTVRWSAVACKPGGPQGRLGTARAHRGPARVSGRLPWPKQGRRTPRMRLPGPSRPKMLARAEESRAKTPALLLAGRLLGGRRSLAARGLSRLGRAGHGLVAGRCRLGGTSSTNPWLFSQPPAHNRRRVAKLAFRMVTFRLRGAGFLNLPG